MKKQRKIEKDNRGVAIYARKSRITNKGDSIGVQFKQCADYAKKELGLDEDYEFLQYEDKGLSGYFSDRPDFQRMLHDVQDGKIKAIVCYKLDRVGRKTADLIRLMDFLEMYHVDLLICSNGINTASGLYKIFIQIFAVIAEFERDTLTERIVDNMMELAKDGRWLGGNTPMGFTVRRVTTGSGKGKNFQFTVMSSCHGADSAFMQIRENRDGQCSTLRRVSSGAEFVKQNQGMTVCFSKKRDDICHVGRKGT